MRPSLQQFLALLAVLCGVVVLPVAVDARLPLGAAQEAAAGKGAPLPGGEAPGEVGPAPQRMLAVIVAGLPAAESAEPPRQAVPRLATESAIPTRTPLVAPPIEARPVLASLEAAASAEGPSLLAQWPAEVAVISQPALVIPGAVVPIQVLVTGTAEVEGASVEYDLQRLSWPDAQ